MPSPGNADSVTSADGTTIVFDVVGEGPGLVVLPGSLACAHHLKHLADRLADSWTVYTVNRRGRAKSGPQGADFSFEREAEDVIAVLEEARATALFGHSAGSLVALETALRTPLEKLALYEPPVSVGDPVPEPWFPAFEAALADGRKITAMAMLQKELEGAILPLPLLKIVVGATAVTDEGWEAIEMLSTFPAEYREVERLSYAVERYRKVNAETIILAGGRSPDYYHEGAELLNSIMPRSSLVKISGLAHEGPFQRPGEVAKQLREFLTGSGEEPG